MSTFSYESIRLLNDGEYLRAALYGGGTVFGCFAATFTGIVLAAKLL
jgi:fluoride ion exporter CrcB/FEX